MSAVDALIRRIVFIVDAAAAIFLAVITMLTFTAVILRYVFTLPFPGSFDVSRLLLGVAIFWGIAAAAYRKDHIQVDLFWQTLPPAGRRVLDVFSDIVFLGFASVLAWMLFWQVDRVRLSNQTTFELDIPIWPFYGVAWLGIALCVLVLIARVLRGFISSDHSATDT